jgi:enoyl-CoA hydratase
MRPSDGSRKDQVSSFAATRPEDAAGATEAAGTTGAATAGTLDDALEWAHEIAALAPLALAHNKLVLNGGSEDEVNASFAAVWASDDVREAAAARAEKRAPKFTGR